MVKLTLFLSISVFVCLLASSKYAFGEEDSSEYNEKLLADYNELNNDIINRLVHWRQQQQQDKDSVMAEKRFPKWRGGLIKSKESLTNFHGNYGNNNAIRKVWEKNMKEKNRMYDKTNLLV